MADYTRILDRNSRTARLTLITRLANAPFPVGNEVAGFFTETDSVTGARLRTVAGNTYGERDHYDDDRVVLHVPPAFDPARPWRILLYFHGHRTEALWAACTEQAVAAQLTRSGANAILIAPQLAKRAKESHPGRLALPGHGALLVEEALTVLSETLGMPLESDSPVLIAAFSGGHRAAANCLTHGGFGERIEGSILLDALYGCLTEFDDWRSARPKAFLIALAGATTRGNTASLRTRLQGDGFEVKSVFPARIASGTTALTDLETPHAAIPVAGPPRWPIAEILARLP